MSACAGVQSPAYLTTVDLPTAGLALPTRSKGKARRRQNCESCSARPDGGDFLLIQQRLRADLGRPPAKG